MLWFTLCSDSRKSSSKNIKGVHQQRFLFRYPVSYRSSRTAHASNHLLAVTASVLFAHTPKVVLAKALVDCNMNRPPRANVLSQIPIHRWRIDTANQTPLACRKASIIGTLPADRIPILNLDLNVDPHNLMMFRFNSPWQILVGLWTSWDLATNEK
jgi:hypothetical protein